MQDQSSHDEDHESIKDLQLFRERSILMLLLIDGQCVWSVEELVSEIGHRLDTIDALDRLKAGGLINRCGDFVFATRAAIRFESINED